MIEYREGNLLESHTEALVNTVNTVGVMGKGVALQFKKYFPHNYYEYHKACKTGRVHTGKMFVTEEALLDGNIRTIINFPTKEHWKQPSRIEYIEEGLDDLKKVIQERGIKSITLPPLGCGNGKLVWNTVKKLIEDKLSGVDAQIIIYTPNEKVKELLDKEDYKLTPARAMLLNVFYDLVRHDEYVSEFAGEKICYFLQRFGSEDIFKLEYKAAFYGPYSGKVRHVLYALNGRYLMGYSQKDKKPFDPLEINMKYENEINTYLEKKLTDKDKRVLERTKRFLSGSYTNMSLELLSSIDFIFQHDNVSTVDDILEKITNWNQRKSKLFNNRRFVEISLKKLSEFGLTQQNKISFV